MKYLDKAVFERCLEDSVAIFGAGKRGRFIAEMLSDMGCHVSFFLDNDIQKQGKEMGGVPIISPERFAEINEGFWILLSFRNQEIEHQLFSLGIDCEFIIDSSACSKGNVLPFFYEFCKKSLSRKEYRFLLQEDERPFYAAVSKLEFYDGILFIRGWMIPSDCINKVRIRINEVTEVSALWEERMDVTKSYPYHHTEKCGFFYIDGTEWREDITIDILFGESKASIRNIVRHCKYETSCKIINDYFQEGKHEELMRTILKRKDYLLRAKERVAKALRDNVDKFVEIRDKLFIYVILYRLGIFKKGDMSDYLKLIESLDNIGAQAWLCEQEIPWMIFLYPQFKTEDIYCWQRRMYHHIAAKIYAEKEVQKKKNEKKIVILVDNLASDVYASAIFEIAIANELQKRGYQVLMVVLDTSFSSDLPFFSCIKLQRNSKQYDQYHIKMRNSDWTIYYCQKENFLERKIEVYDVIEKYNPGVVIDISQAGLIVSAALYQHQFKIIHISLSGYSSGAVFNYYIAKSKKLCQIDNEVYHSINEEQIYEAPIKIPYNIEIVNIYQRRNFGICDDDFVLVTVGNRLQHEMDIDFLMCIRKLLKNNAKFKWVIVGKNLGFTFYDYMNDAIERGQIIEWGFEENLPSLYQICDVYVNPNRLGGCGSVELAMEYGIPIAMTKMMSDVMPVIKDENCKIDYDEMLLYIKNLYDSSDFRTVEGQKMKQLINRNDLRIEHYVDVIMRAYQDCEKRGDING